MLGRFGGLMLSLEPRLCDVRELSGGCCLGAPSGGVSARDTGTLCARSVWGGHRCHAMWGAGAASCMAMWENSPPQEGESAPELALRLRDSDGKQRLTLHVHRYKRAKGVIPNFTTCLF